MVMARPNLNEARSKIVVTVGPACDSVEMLLKMVHAGADVIRINTAHGKQADFDRILGHIRQVRELSGFPLAVLLDLAGPKLRLGQLLQDPLQVEVGMQLTFVRGDQVTHAQQLCSSYLRLVDEVEVGNQIMLADGTISLRVVSKSQDEFVCEALTEGVVRSRQGINLPGVKLSVTAMLPIDVENAKWAAENDIDFVSLSFVRSPDDVQSLKTLLASLHSNALVIAKIEKREALQQLDAIVEAADGIMVARGDLGVEIDVAETPVAQKRIIEVCRQKLRPVIVATQMLESMHTNRRPTRAEASDVANAILDGADACMLSGETAIGDFPLEAVATMDRIMFHTEQLLKGQPPGRPAKVVDKVDAITSAVTYSAANIASAIDAKLVVVASRSGSTAWIKAKQRNYIPTLGVSNVDATLRRMCLFWGIMPHRVSCFEEPTKLIEEVSQWGQEQQLLTPGDRVVFVTGTGVISNTHNLLVVHEVQA